MDNGSDYEFSRSIEDQLAKANTVDSNIRIKFKTGRITSSGAILGRLSIIHKHLMTTWERTEIATWKDATELTLIASSATVF